MSPELASYFDALSNELVSIHLRWNQYLTLFADREAIAVLNRTASSFFRMVQDVLFEATLLAIVRIAGKEKSAGNHVLSIETLIKLVRAECQVDMAKLVNDARVAVKDLLKWRHRRIAHRDLSLALKRQDAMPLPAVTRSSIEASLSALDRVLNFVSRAYSGAETHYPTVIVLGDAKDLLYFIRYGLKHESNCEPDVRAEWIAR